MDNNGFDPKGDGFQPEDDSLFDEAEERVRSGRASGKKRGFWKEVGLLARLARSVANHEYELETPKMLALFGALAYVVSPVDAVPDVIPIFGLADDAGVVAATLSVLSYELIQYREWEIAAEAA